MKRLILVRHSKTEHYNFEVTDFERSLTKRGKSDAGIIAEQLKNNGIVPDYFISSKAKRALQTTSVFAGVLNFPEERVNIQQFLYNGYTTNEFLNFISTVDNTYNTIIVIAHNPDIASLASSLSEEEFYHFPTTATAVINFDTDKWDRINAREGKVHLFLYPRIFKE